MDCLLSFAPFAPSEGGLPLRRVLLGPFSPFIHDPYDFAERFPSLGGSVLDMQRESWEDFSGENTCFFQLSQSHHECLWTDSCHRSLELTKPVVPLHNMVE
jgi:hypothetical protein